MITPAKVTLEVSLSEILNVDEIIEYLDEEGFLSDYKNKDQQ